MIDRVFGCLYAVAKKGCTVWFVFAGDFRYGKYLYTSAATVSRVWKFDTKFSFTWLLHIMDFERGGVHLFERPGSDIRMKGYLKKLKVTAWLFFFLSFCLGHLLDLLQLSLDVDRVCFFTCSPPPPPLLQPIIIRLFHKGHGHNGRSNSLCKRLYMCVCSRALSIFFFFFCYRYS